MTYKAQGKGIPDDRNQEVPGNYLSCGGFCELWEESTVKLPVMFSETCYDFVVTRL